MIAQPISAFAAAKAKAQAWRESKEDAHDADSNDEDGGSENVDSDLGDPLFIRESEMEAHAEPELYLDEADDVGLEDSPPSSLTDSAFQNICLSTFIPSSANVTQESNKAVVIHLEPNDSITLLGHFELWVKSGCVSLYGAKLPPGRARYTVYAPATHSLPCITCWPLTNSEIEIWKSGNSSIRLLSRISPLYRRIWNDSSKVDKSALNTGGFSFLASSSDDPMKRVLLPLIVTPEHQGTMQMICHPQNRRCFKAMICGPKNSGKSTFGRLLINYVLTTHLIAADSRTAVSPTPRICFLDLDPGQPEFTAPGQLSLVLTDRLVLGPPFTNPISNNSETHTIVRAHSIAAVSPKEDPLHFLQCALDLLDCYSKVQGQYPDCPLIVNCPGWILGVALEIISQILGASEMTDVVYLSQGDVPGVVQTLRSAAGAARFHNLRSEKTAIVSLRTAADFRAMQYMSYFHLDQKDASGSASWRSSPLTTRTPWVIRYDKDSPDILGLMSLGEQPHPDFLPVIYEGSLVSITIIEDDVTLDELAKRIERNKNENLPYITADNSGMCPPPPPSKSRSVGLGLITHIDVEAQALLLHTPLHKDVLSQIVASRGKTSRIVFIRGHYDTPGWAYQETLYKARHDERAGSQAANASRPELDEQLAIDAGASDYDEEVSEPERVLDVPWIRTLQTGERAAPRWRVRRDFGKPLKRRKFQTR